MQVFCDILILAWKLWHLVHSSELTVHSSPYKNLYKIILMYISYDFGVIYHFIYLLFKEMLIYSFRKTYLTDLPKL
jgi:hypothetical protein